MATNGKHRTALASVAVIVLYFLFLFIVSHMMRIGFCEFGGLLEESTGCGSSILWTIMASSLSVSIAFFVVFRIWPNAHARIVTMVFMIGCICWSILFWFIAIILEATLVALLYAGFIGLPTGTIAALVACSVRHAPVIRTIAFVLMTALTFWSILFFIFALAWAKSMALLYLVFTGFPIGVVAVLVDQGKFLPVKQE